LNFSITPKTSRVSGMLEMGIGPAFSATVVDLPPSPEADATWARETAAVGLTGVEQGMTLVSVGPSPERLTPVSSAHAIEEALRAADGSPITLVFAKAEPGPLHLVTIEPQGEMERADVNPNPKVLTLLEHVAGLAPVMRVAAVPEGAKHGLLPGD